MKNIKIRKEYFKSYLKETKEHIKSNKGLIELDKIDSTYIKSYSVLYSILLRLRGLFIINCFLSESYFSNKKFKKWLIDKGLNRQEFKVCYNAYRLVRDNKDVKILKISIRTAEKILNILKKELSSLEAEIYNG